eukprot:3196369-Pleurochrysis_carterae.AAC.1
MYAACVLRALFERVQRGPEEHARGVLDRQPRRAIRQKHPKPRTPPPSQSQHHGKLSRFGHEHRGAPSPLGCCRPRSHSTPQRVLLPAPSILARALAPPRNLACGPTPLLNGRQKRAGTPHRRHRRHQRVELS